MEAGDFGFGEAEEPDKYPVGILAEFRSDFLDLAGGAGEFEGVIHYLHFAGFRVL